MSAFMLPEDRFTQLHDYLVEYPVLIKHICESLADDNSVPSSLGKALVIIDDWHDANRRAMIGRYGKKVVKEDKIPRHYNRSAVAHPLLTHMQAVALLTSLVYQCSETVDESETEDHDYSLETMNRALGRIALGIVQDSGDYHQAAETHWR